MTMEALRATTRWSGATVSPHSTTGAHVPRSLRLRSGFRMPLHRPQTSGGEYGNYADLDSTSSVRSPGGGRGGGYSQDSASWINDPEFEAGMSVEDFRNNEDMSSVGSLTAPSDMAYGRGSQHITVPRVPPPSVNRMAGFSGIEGRRLDGDSRLGFRWEVVWGGRQPSPP